MMAEGIGDAADAPTVFFVPDRADGSGAGGNGAIKDGVRIVDDQGDAKCAASEGFRAEILIGRRLVSQPEASGIDGELCNYASVFCVDAIQRGCTEGAGVEVD